MKKILSVLLLLAVVSAASSKVGDTFTIDGLKYTVKVENEKTQLYQVSVKKANDNLSGVITIPETVTNGDITYDVTTLENNAFINCSGITDVVLNSKITALPTGPFANCTGLKSYVIPSTITSIGNQAFRGCTNLTEVNIPASVTSIGTNDAFWGTSSDLVLNFDSDELFIVEDGILYNKEKTRLMHCPINKTGVTIPETVTEIDGHAFCLNSSTEIALPSGLKTIGDDAFAQSALTSVTIPASVTKIGSSAFNHYSSNLPAGYSQSLYQNNLTSVVFEEGCKANIPQSCFANCKGLTSVTFSSEQKRVENYAFSSCEKLDNVNLPESLTFIGDGAFRQMFALSEITIPKNVESIGESAFMNCSHMKNISFAEGCKVKTIAKSAFSGCFNFNDVQIVLPENITTIGEKAFYGNSGILVFKIPNSVTSIGKNMLENITRLPHLTLPSHITALDLTNLNESKQILATEQTIPGSVTTTTGSLPKNLTKIYMMGTEWPANFRANHANRTDMTVYVKPSALQSLKNEMLLGETPVSGTYKIQNAGSGKYVQVKSKYYAKPDATEADATEVHVGVAEQMAPGAYKVNSLSGDAPNGDNIEAYDYLTLAVTLAKAYVDNFDAQGENNELTADEKDRVKELIDEYVDQYGFMQVKETGVAGQMYALVEVPAIPEEVTAMAAEHHVTDVWKWAVGKVKLFLEELNLNSANFKTVKSYVLNNIDKVEPGHVYYLTAEDNNTFGFVTEEELAGAGEYAKWNVSVTELDQETPGFKLETQIPVTFGAGKKYITMCRDFDVDLSHSEGLKAYVPTSYNPETDMVELEEISYVPSRLKADELGVDEYVGVILERTAEDVSEEATLYYTMGENDCYSGHQDKQENLTSRNWMVGANDRTYVEMEEDGKTNYGLNAGMVKKYSKAGWLAYNKAYISTDGIDDDNHGGKTTTSLGLSKKASQQTGVKRISAKELGVDMWFDLNGRFVANPVEGNIYIHNGKKVKK